MSQMNGRTNSDSAQTEEEMERNRDGSQEAESASSGSPRSSQVKAAKLTLKGSFGEIGKRRSLGIMKGVSEAAVRKNFEKFTSPLIKKVESKKEPLSNPVSEIPSSAAVTPTVEGKDVADEPKETKKDPQAPSAKPKGDKRKGGKGRKPRRKRVPRGPVSADEQKQLCLMVTSLYQILGDYYDQYASGSSSSSEDEEKPSG